MTVTVLMTVYNGAAFLESTVNSILKQSFKDFEFLIVNDKSTDKSLEVIAKFKDARIRVIDNPENIGQTCSLNVGLKAAKGKFIARMDADDKARPDWLDVMVRHMEQHSEAVVISPRARRMDAAEKPLRLLYTPQTHRKIFLKSLFSSPINHVGCMYRKEAILKVGGYNEKYKIAADYALWCTLLRQGSTLKNIKPVLVDIRTHAQSISVLEANKRVATEMITIYEENLPRWVSQVPDKHQLNYIWKVVFYPQLGFDEEFARGIKPYLHVYVSLGQDAPIYALKEVVKMYLKRMLGKKKNV